MSNHHSQKSINLHHEQVNAGKERRQRRQDEHLTDYLLRRAEAMRCQLFAVALGVVCFGYSMVASAVWLGYIL